MLEQKYWGLPLWVWVIIFGIITAGCYQTMNSIKPSVELESSDKSVESIPTENFTETVQLIDDSRVKVFNFNTRWCGWSRRFRPEWEAFTERTKTDPLLSHVDAYDIKCEDDENESMCTNYEVPGFPFVIIETKGKRTQYNGERTANALVKYILG